jgi:hypothetical protein
MPNLFQDPGWSSAAVIVLGSNFTPFPATPSGLETLICSHKEHKGHKGFERDRRGALSFLPGEKSLRLRRYGSFVIFVIFVRTRMQTGRSTALLELGGASPNPA